MGGGRQNHRACQKGETVKLPSKLQLAQMSEFTLKAGSAHAMGSRDQA